VLPGTTDPTAGGFAAGRPGKSLTIRSRPSGPRDVHLGQRARTGTAAHSRASRPWTAMGSGRSSRRTSSS
jgi:hypothetical protein